MRNKNNYNFRCGISLKIYPSNKQKLIISVNDGISRFIYNRLVANGRESYLLRKAAGKVPVYQDRLNFLRENYKDTKSMKNIIPFLNNPLIDGCAIANAKANYNQAWDNFKTTHHVPTFHKKGYSKSYQTNAVYSDDINLMKGSVRFVDKSHIQIPKLGVIRFSASKKKVDMLFRNADNIKIGTVTVKMDAAGDYYISLQLASNSAFAEISNKTGKALGIDVNLRNYLTTSDGDVVDNPKFLKKESIKLSKEQRKMSRRQLVAEKNTDPRDKKRYLKAKNYQKQRIKVAEIHKKVANQRKDFLHKLSTEIVKNHDIIVVEDLKISNLKKNHKLARAISDAAWGTFLTMLEYKAEWYGKIFIKVPPAYTTQTCSHCGHVMSGKEKLSLAIEDWICPECGTHHIRDWNAAINILMRGLTLLKKAA